MDIPLLFGRFLVKQGKVKEAELHSALKVQKEINLPLSVFALESGCLTLESFMAALKCQREYALTFREAALRLKLIEEAVITELEEKQGKSATNIGAILIKKGSLTQEDLETKLADFTNEKNT